MKRRRAGTMTHDDIRTRRPAVCRAQCPRRHGDRPIHGTPSAPEFIRFPNRIGARQARPCYPRQLCRRPQAPPSARLARPSPYWTFHFTATCCSSINAVDTFFAGAYLPAPATRRLPFAGRPPGRDQPLPRRRQPQTQTLRLDRRSQPHHRENQSRVLTIGVCQLAQETAKSIGSVCLLSASPVCC